MNHSLRPFGWLLMAGLSAIPSLCFGQSASPTQQKSWYFSKKQLEFYDPGYSQPSVYTNNNPGSSSATINYSLAHAATSAFSNSSFYIDPRTRKVYGNDGTVGGQIANSVQSQQFYYYGTTDPIYYGQVTTEIAIVPVPGACKQFYAFYHLIAPLNYLALVRCTIDCSSSTPVVSDETLMYEGTGSGGLAVSRANANGSRFLYDVSNGAIRRYAITSAGVSTGTVATTLPYFATYEADLSPDGTHIGFGSSDTGTIFCADVTPSTGAVTNLRSKVFPVSTKYIGVEFSPNSNSLYASYRNDAGLVSTTGVSKWNLPANTIQATLPGSSGYGGSQVELGYDGLLYMVSTTPYNSSNGDFKLGVLDPATDAFSLSTADIGLYGFSPASPQLPDQVDGEDYTNFAGVPQPTITNIQIAGKTPLNTDPYTLSNFYNCQALPLTATVTDVATYQVELSGGTYFQPYDYNTPMLTALPTDLRSLDNGHIVSNPGKYSVYIRVYNKCGDMVAGSATVYINSVPTGGGYAYNTGQSAGFDSTPSYDSTQPLAVGGNGATLVMNAYYGSAGIDSYRATIDSYTPGGNYTRVCQTTVSIPSSQAVRTTLNSLVSNCVGNSYFTQHLNQNFRLTLDLINPCGTTTSTSYFTPTTNAYRTAQTLASASPVATDEWSVYPNPATDKLHISLPATSSLKQLYLLTLLGQPVSTGPISKQGDVNVSGVAAGIYMLKIETDTQTLYKRIEIAR